MIPSAIPSRPWQKLATDLFEIDGKDYLLLTDYYSNFFEINLLNNTTTNNILKYIKDHFSRYGLPDVLVSDNGP